MISFLQSLFQPFGITSLEEVTLSANEALSDEKRLQWNINDSPLPTPPGMYKGVVVHS